jgi:hypothetical protein
MESSAYEQISASDFLFAILAFAVSAAFSAKKIDRFLQLDSVVSELEK